MPVFIYSTSYIKKESIKKETVKRENRENYIYESDNIAVRGDIDGHTINIRFAFG